MVTRRASGPQQAEHVHRAEWAAAFLASDEARWIIGVTLPVESGVLSVTPLMMAPYLRAVSDPGQ